MKVKNIFLLRILKPDITQPDHSTLNILRKLMILYPWNKKKFSKCCCLVGMARYELLKIVPTLFCYNFSSPVGSLCHTRGVVRCPSFVVRRTSCANVHHVPGLCLLGIGGAPYISHKIMAQKTNFHIFDFFS